MAAARRHRHHAGGICSRGDDPGGLTAGVSIRASNADVLEVSVLPSSAAGYWPDCGFGTDIAEEAFDVVASLLAGEYPQWFADRYGLEDGGFALSEFWAHVVRTNDVDPFFRQALVWLRWSPDLSPRYASAPHRVVRIGLQSAA